MWASNMFGVTVITGMAVGDRPHGFTIGSFTSVSLDPPLVGFLPQTDSETWALMADAGSFCVNVLSDKQSDLCWKFAKSGTEAARFDGVEWHAAPSGAPVLERAVAWIDCQDRQHSVFSYRRRSGDDELVIILTATPTPRSHYRIGAPRAGRWKILLNSDAWEFAGSQWEVLPHAETEAVAWHGFPDSFVLQLPPLGCLILARESSNG